MSADDFFKFLNDNHSVVSFILNHYKKRVKAVSDNPSIQSRFVGIFREEVSENLLPKIDRLSTLVDSESDCSKFVPEYLELLKSAVACYLADFELTKIHIANELIVSPPYSPRIKIRHELIRELDRFLQNY